MSGTFLSRVNRTWDKSNPNISAAVFFWEWLHFIDDHPNMSFVGYGTGKTQSGTTPPSGWTDWDPTVTASPPFGDNSWFVFEADNASAELDGGGTKKWQAKLQVTLATAFDDCNVADVDYGWETTTYSAVMRTSAEGGWNGTTLEFQPAGGEDASVNLSLFNGQDKYFGIDIIADDDTVFWRGAAVSSNLLSEGPALSRGGYLGMVQRLHSGIENPFLFAAGRIADEAANFGYRSINYCYDNNAYMYAWRIGGVNWGGVSQSWPSYSIWKDGSKIEAHYLDTWDKSALPLMTPDVFGDAINWAVKIAQWKDPDKYAIIGELRLVAKTGWEYGHSALYGDNDEWLQFAYRADIVSGMGMRWPQGIAPIW